MKFEIKNRYSGNVIFSFECGSLKLCVEAAVKTDADLRGAYLRYAYLGGAYLRYADLRGADLRGADLRYADLRGAYLRDADLRYADLRYADLRGAYLRDADLRDANLSPYSVCPPCGDFIGWKKGGNGELIKLLIPWFSMRTSSIVSRKCRAELVKVLSIEYCGEQIKSCCSGYNNGTIYTVGEYTKPDKYVDDRRIECAHGIHFFITPDEARNY